MQHLNTLKGAYKKQMGTDFLVGPVVIGQEVVVLTKGAYIQARYKEVFSYDEGSEKMEQVSLRDYRFSIPGNIPCQFGQIDVAEFTPAQGTGLESMIFKVSF